MSEELNIVDIINMMFRKWWLIAVLMVVMGMAAYMYTDLFMDPMYRTDGALYVNPETQTTELDAVASAGRLNSASRLAATYAEILKRRSFLSQVSDALENKYSYSQIQKMLEVSVVNQTELLELRVTGTNPEDVYEILQAILQYAPDELVRVVRAGSVAVVDYPYIPRSPISPSKIKNTLIGVLVGMIAGVLIIFLMELFDTHIKSGEEVKTKYDEPLLAEIPSLNRE